MYSKIHAVVCISLKKTFMGGGKGKKKKKEQLNFKEVPSSLYR